jgi:hypothetical protein
MTEIKKQEETIRETSERGKISISFTLCRSRGRGKGEKEEGREKLIKWKTLGQKLEDRKI